MTLHALLLIHLLASFSTGRSWRGHRVYRKVFRKMGRWVMERGRVGDLGGRGISKVYLRHRAPSFDTTGRRVSDRMCERGRHPQGWTRYPEFWRRDQTFKLQIWGLKETKSGFERLRRRVGEKACEELKHGCHETAASPSADCAYAHKDREGRINVWLNPRVL